MTTSSFGQEKFNCGQHSPDGSTLVSTIGQSVLGDNTKSQTKENARFDAMRKALNCSGTFVLSCSRIKDGLIDSDFLANEIEAFIRSKEISYSYDKLTETGTWNGTFYIHPYDLKNHLKKLENRYCGHDFKIKEWPPILGYGEEKVMESCGCPDLKEHRKLHRDHLEMLMTHARCWSDTRSPQSLSNLQNFLRFWLIDHVGKEDISIAQYTKGKERELQVSLNEVSLKPDAMNIKQHS